MKSHKQPIFWWYFFAFFSFNFRSPSRYSFTSPWLRIYVAIVCEVAVKYFTLRNAMRTPPCVHSVLHIDRTDMLCACTLPNGTKQIICQIFVVHSLHCPVKMLSQWLRVWCKNDINTRQTLHLHRFFFVIVWTVHFFFSRCIASITIVCIGFQWILKNWYIVFFFLYKFCGARWKDHSVALIDAWQKQNPSKWKTSFIICKNWTILPNSFDSYIKSTWRQTGIFKINMFSSQNRFPTDNEWAQKWERKIKEFDPSYRRKSNDIVCSLHFAKSSMISVSRQLVDHALPIYFPRNAGAPQPTKKQDEPTVKRPEPPTTRRSSQSVSNSSSDQSRCCIVECTTKFGGPDDDIQAIEYVFSSVNRFVWAIC